MDNDLCIIYEKGLKPIKDEKYYYFETPMARKLAEVTLNHLEFDVGNRGKWRKFNPYNPYVENEEDKPRDLKVESLDDLFEDDTSGNNVDNVNNDTDKSSEMHMQKENVAPKAANIGAENTNPMPRMQNARVGAETDDAPVLPNNGEDIETLRNEDDVMSVDVQKELEAKFDELFGAFDDEDDK